MADRDIPEEMVRAGALALNDGHERHAMARWGNQVRFHRHESQATTYPVPGGRGVPPDAAPTRLQLVRLGGGL